MRDISRQYGLVYQCIVGPFEATPDLGLGAIPDVVAFEETGCGETWRFHTSGGISAQTGERGPGTGDGPGGNLVRLAALDGPSDATAPGFGPAIDVRSAGSLVTSEGSTTEMAPPSVAPVVDRLSRAVFEGAHDAIFVADDQGHFTEVNPAAGELCGLDPAELIGRRIAEFLPPGSNFPLAWADFRRIGHRRGPLRLYRPDGSTRDVEFNAVADVLPGRHLAVIRDRTEWKRIEDARHESERLARSVLDSLPNQIAVLDEAGMILQVNNSWRESSGEVIPLTSMTEGVNYLLACDSVVGEQIRLSSGLAASIRKVLNGGRQSFAHEYSCDFLDRKRWYVGRVHPFQGEGPRRVVVSLLDVTDVRLTEETLVRYDGRLQILRSIYRAILAARSPEEIARVALEHLAGHIPFAWGRVEAIDFESGEVRILATQGSARPSLPAADPADSGVQFDLQFPLLHDEKPVGSLEFGSEEPLAFQDDHIQLAREVADQLAIVIRQALYLEEIRVSKERLELISRRLIRAEEDLRRQIARELHDEIGQAMTAVKFHLQHAREHRIDPVLVLSRMNEAIHLVDRTLRQVRSISLDLRPSLLDDFGLTVALRSLLKAQSRIGGFSTQFDVDADDPEFRLAPELETACYRVAQESLTNIVRHAGARHVEVRLEMGQEDLQLFVIDDGIAFDVEMAMANSSAGVSFGLIGMRERVKLLGGQMEIRSTQGKGTKIHACFPVVLGEHVDCEIPHQSDPSGPRG